MAVVGACRERACQKGACGEGACRKRACHKEGSISSKAGIGGKAGIGVSSSKDRALSVIYSGGVSK